MSLLSKKRKRAHWIYTLPFILILLGLVFVSGRAAFNAFGKLKESSKRRAEAERELQSVQSRLDNLEKKVDYLNTEKGVEEEIRTKFNVAKDGEKVFVIVGDDSKKSEENEEEKGFFKGLWEGFLNLIGF